MKAHFFVPLCLRMRLERAKKIKKNKIKNCSFALTSKMTHSLWWEHLILSVWCCCPSSSSSCIHPPRHVAFILLRVTSAPCAAEQHSGFYGSCCSQRTHGPGGEEEEKAPNGQFWVPNGYLPRSATRGAFGEDAPRAGGSPGWLLLGNQGPRAFAFSSSAVAEGQ